jgi:hypothetical protein
MLERAKNREYFYEFLIKLIGICKSRGIRFVFENPYSSWFFEYEPTHGRSIQKDKESKTIWGCKAAKQAGICSEERSLISPDYARNFICDFILGKEQKHSEPSLKFDIE